MTPIDEDDEENEDASLPEQGMKKKVLVYLIPIIIVIGAVVGLGLFFFSNANKKGQQNYDVVSQKSEDGSKVTVFYTLPEFTANLRTSSGIYETIRIKLNLELPSVNDIPQIEGMMPRINDIILGHLSELSPEEVSGAEGLFALKEELLYRINLMVSPQKVSNLNIKSLDIKINDAD